MRYDSQLENSDAGSAVATTLVGALRVLWNLIRFPILAVLTLLEGVMQTVLGALAFLSFLTALFFEYATPVMHFPFWETLTFCAGCFLTLVLYYVLVRVLSRYVPGRTNPTDRQQQHRVLAGRPRKLGASN